MQAARAIVLSDIHMGPGGPLTVFRDADALSGFLGVLADEGTPTELLLAGDVFDFLQFPDYSGFDAARAVDRFLAIARNNQQVFDMLRRFGSLPKNELTLLSGNHDPEVMLPAVRAAFEHAVGRTGSVRYEEELTPSGDSRWSIQGRSLVNGSVWVVHGDRWDVHNAIDRDRLIREQRVDLPTGSSLVYEVLSHIQRQFPWVYELKPEVEAVLPLLYYLDPARTRRYLLSHFQLSGRMLRGMVEAALPSGEVLGEAPGAADEQDVAHLLAGALAEALAKEPDPQRELLLSQLNTWQPQQGADGPTLAPHDGVGRWLLRAWLRRVRKSDRFLALDAEDEVLERAAPYLPDGVDALVAGHTHGPRLRRDIRPAYLNSGTWIPVGRLAQGEMDQIIDDLEQNRPWPATVPRTFVSISADGELSLGACDERGVPGTIER